MYAQMSSTLAVKPFSAAAPPAAYTSTLSAPDRSIYWICPLLGLLMPAASAAAFTAARSNVRSYSVSKAMCCSSSAEISRLMDDTLSEMPVSFT